MKNTTTLDEMLDRTFGAKGTPLREEYDNEFRDFFIGEFIQTSRQQKGLTQQQLADLCGMNKSYISKIENNVKEARISTLRKIISKGLGGRLELRIVFDD